MSLDGKSLSRKNIEIKTPTVPSRSSIQLYFELDNCHIIVRFGRIPRSDINFQLVGLNFKCWDARTCWSEQDQPKKSLLWGGPWGWSSGWRGWLLTVRSRVQFLLLQNYLGELAIIKLFNVSSQKGYIWEESSLGGAVCSCNMLKG